MEKFESSILRNYRLLKHFVYMYTSSTETKRHTEIWPFTFSLSLHFSYLLLKQVYDGLL